MKSLISVRHPNVKSQNRAQFVHLHISELKPCPSHTLSPPPTPQKCSLGLARAGIVENFAICMWNSPSEIWPNIQLVFIPQLPVQRKGRAKLPPSMTASHVHFGQQLPQHRGHFKLRGRGRERLYPL